MIKGIHHVAIHTPNLDRLTKFYGDLFGFVAVGKEYRTQNNPAFDKICGVPGCNVRNLMLNMNNVFLELWEFSAPQGRSLDPRNPNDHGFTHICIEVGDIDEEYRRLSAAGMTFVHHEPVELVPGCKAVYGRDPDGNVIEVQELPSGTKFSFDSLSRTRQY
jgi:glyoxylase I family protein